LDKKAASPPQMDGSIEFARWHQCATLSDTWYLFHPSPHTKRYLDRFNCFFHRSRQKVPIFYNGRPLFPLKIAPIAWGIWTSV